MFNEVEFYAYGGFAIVSFLLWLTFIVIIFLTFWNSRLSLPIKRFFSSVRFAFKRNRPLRDGDRLYRYGYIYKWAKFLNAKFNKNRM